MFPSERWINQGKDVLLLTFSIFVTLLPVSIFTPASCAAAVNPFTNVCQPPSK
ncbi:MAG: hypothetical protein ACM3VV_08160 [Deltaproteobacteria bacterium]